jgi:hypothetical protein
LADEIPSTLAIDWAQVAETNRTVVRSMLRQQFRDQVVRVAAERVALKHGRREMSRNGDVRLVHVDLAMNRLRREARVVNVAYGIFLGRQWAEIEQNHPAATTRSFVRAFAPWVHAFVKFRSDEERQFTNSLTDFARHGRSRAELMR